MEYYNDMKVRRLNGAQYPFRTGWCAESRADPRFFALKVADDTMKSVGIASGDTVIVRRQDVVDQNDIAAVSVNDGEAMLRYVHTCENLWILDSSDGPAQLYDAAAVRIMGKVVERRRTF